MSGEIVSISNSSGRARRGRFAAVFTSAIQASVLGAIFAVFVPAIAYAQEQSTQQFEGTYPNGMDMDRAEIMYEVLVAELAGRRGYMEVAAVVYLRAAKRSNDPKVAERATKLAVWAQEWSLAKEAASRWLFLEPESVEARELLSQVLILSSADSPSDNLTEIEKELEKDPDNIALRTGYARLLADVGRYTEADEQHEYLFKNAGDDSNVLLSIGLLALDSNRTESAKKYLEALLLTGDHSDQANYYLARIADQNKAVEDAISYYDKVGESDMYFSSQLRAAELYAASNQLELGIEKLRALSPFLPDPSMAPMLITTESRMLINAEQPSRAIDVLSEGLEKYPDSGELLYARALAADSMGDSETLMTDLEALLVSDPNNANALNALGYFLADENMRLGEAEMLIEKAMNLKPDDPAIMDSLGWLRFRQGDREAAKNLLEAAYSLLPDPEIAAHLGEVLWVSGDEVGAQSIWDKALLESPDHKKLNNTVERLTQ